MSDDLVFDTLGPLLVRRAGRPVDLGPPQRRRLLLRLLAADGWAVSLEDLQQDLWAGRPPRGAVSSVHAHVSRLRAALEPGHAALIVRDESGPGYTLAVPRASLVSARFETAVDEANRLFALGRLDVVRDRLAEALGWWRGSAFADARGLAFAELPVARLTEARLAAQEMAITACLKLRDYRTAVPQARTLVAAHALRESAWELLIRGLYLAGRPAESLEECDRIRQRLADDLGAEPGPALRELHRAILLHDLTAVAGG